MIVKLVLSIVFLEAVSCSCFYIHSKVSASCLIVSSVGQNLYTWKTHHVHESDLLTSFMLSLMFRENEAAGQLQLIHQLEAGLRKQQQIIEAKDEV